MIFVRNPFFGCQCYRPHCHNDDPNDFDDFDDDKMDCFDDDDDHDDDFDDDERHRRMWARQGWGPE